MRGAWFWWFLIGMYMLDSVVRVTSIDEPRNATTRGAAAFGMVVNALLIWGIAAYGILR